MAVTITFDPNSTEDLQAVRLLLNPTREAEALNAAAVPEGAKRVDVPREESAPATEPPSELTDEFMREQFRLAATKPGCKDAAFAIVEKYGKGQRTLTAVDKSEYAAMLAELQAL